MGEGKLTLGECAIRRRLKRRITCAEIIGQLYMGGLSFAGILLSFYGFLGERFAD